ncbi:hypothetical protein DPMN_169599 [Dreissena polymorpha]|uniref:Uncharacterized protein n=1 Tax=Dreissena polymorpha TaxID=45954 RepID=A0A9D4DUP5_DREPO|nr:hypothetical protein DPMN_169599 [Dreissena polymorpha]
MVFLMNDLIRRIELKERSHKAEVAGIVSSIASTRCIAGYAFFGVTPRVSIRVPGF